MPEESYSFATARVRLEEIVAQVRKKDTSLEKSLDLLEEGVRLANQCTELIDHADWEAARAGEGGGDASAAVAEGQDGEPAGVRADVDSVDGEHSGDGPVVHDAEPAEPLAEGAVSDSAT